MKHFVKIRKTSPIILLAVSLLLSTLSRAQENSQSWEEWARKESENSEIPVIQNRQIIRSGKFQAMALAGFSNRNDLYNNFITSFSGRYHFSESHGWEFVRLYANFTSETDLHKEVVQVANHAPDVQLAKFQLVTSYVFTPIYGKYAWNDKHTVYFDIHGTIGGGVRFAQDTQPIAEFGIGMNHYVFSRKLSIVPEYRLRIYSEQRSQSTLVFESMAQVGMAWLF